MIKKYWVIILISILLPAGFATTLLTSYFSAGRILGEEITRHTLPLASDNVYSGIQKDLLLGKNISSSMAHDPFVREWILSGEKDPGLMTEYLAEIQKKYNTAAAFFISDMTKLYYQPDGSIRQVSGDEPFDAWYFRAGKGNTPYEINIDENNADRNRLIININHQVPGYDNDLTGITGIGLELKQTGKILDIYQHKYENSIFFVDNSGQVILHASDFNFPNDLYEWENFSAKALSILSGQGISLEHKTEHSVYYVNSRFVPELNLFLVVMKNGDKLQEQLTERLKLNFGIGFLITIVTIGIVGITLKQYDQSYMMLANCDALTGAFNRNAFSQVFEKAVNRNKRKNQELSLILIDLDHFKSINDKHGHHCGDIVLKVFSETITDSIRETDVLCRWGDEEFILFLGNCPLEDAVNVVERIRKTSSELHIPCENHLLNITISAGVVQYRQGETLSQLTARADRVMKQAKNQGKNRVAFEK